MPTLEVVGVTPSSSERRADEGVDERALARVELPHHHEQERLRELRVSVGERLAGRHRPTPSPSSARADLADEAAGVVEEGLPGGVEDELHRVILADSGLHHGLGGAAAEGVRREEREREPDQAEGAGLRRA